MYKKGQSKVLVAGEKRQAGEEKQAPQKENMPPILQEPTEEAPPVLPSPFVPQAVHSAPLSIQRSLDIPPPSVSPQPDSPELAGWRLCSADQELTPPPAFQMPLRETRGPKVLGEDGTIQEGG